MLDGKVIAGLCLKVPLCSEDVSALFSYTEKIRADGFQAGAASRDAYIEQLELALLQVRKAICGDIHNTDDLLALIASRDAELTELQEALKLARQGAEFNFQTAAEERANGEVQFQSRKLVENERDQLPPEGVDVRCDDGCGKDRRNEMTTHDRDKIIAAAKDAGMFSSIPLPQWLPTERFYAIAFEAGRQSVDTPVALAEAYRCGEEAGRVAGFSASIEACQAVGPKEYPNKLITDGYVDAIRARGDMK